MKTFKIITSLLTSCVILMIAFAIVGCEDEPSSDGLNAGDSVANLAADGSTLAGALRITPDNPSVTHVGQQIEFEVSGGHWPYTWSVANTARGSIQVIQNEESGVKFTAVYTVSAVGHNSVIVTDASSREGVVEVTVGGNTALSVAINPSTVDIATPTVGQTFSLAVAGGTPPYEWWVHNTGLGTISASSGTSVVYTVQSSARDTENAVQVKDSYGDSDTATIAHAAAANLAISPGSQSVASNFTGNIVYTAVGGTPPYSWTLSLSSLGTLTPSGGINTTATYNDPGGVTTFVGDNTITLIDALDKSATATVTYE